MNNDHAPEFARAIPVPYEWDDVAGPELSYGLGPTALFGITEAGEPIRITFIGLDAIRICRGEYLPYKKDETEEQCSLLSIVENSRWLRERYDYEARSAVTEEYEVAGIRCQVRTNPKPIEEILQGAFYCSQPLYDFAPERHGFMDVEYSVRVRARRGILQSRLWGFASKPLATLPGVATLEQAKAIVEPFIRQLSETQGERRDQR